MITRKQVVFETKAAKAWALFWRYLTFQFWPWLINDIKIEGNDFSPETWREIRGETI